MPEQLPLDTSAVITDEAPVENAVMGGEEDLCSSAFESEVPRERSDAGAKAYSHDEELPLIDINHKSDQDSPDKTMPLESQGEPECPTTPTPSTTSVSNSDVRSISSTAAICDEASAYKSDKENSSKMQNRKETASHRSQGGTTLQSSSVDYNAPLSTVEERAIRFLTHPSIQNLGLDQKTNFLKEQCGLTKHEIDRALLYQAAGDHFNYYGIHQKAKEKSIPTTQQQLDAAFVDSYDSSLNQRNSSWPRYVAENGSFATTETYDKYGGQAQPRNYPIHHNQHEVPPHPNKNRPSAYGSYARNPQNYDPPMQWPSRGLHSETPLHHPEETRYLPSPRQVQSIDPPSVRQPPHLTSTEADELNWNAELKKTVQVTALSVFSAAATMFGMASWRWLNGGDFELIPPPHMKQALLERQEQADLVRGQNKDLKASKDANLDSRLDESRMNDNNFMNNYHSAMGPAEYTDTFVERDGSPTFKDGNGSHRVVAESIAELAEAVNDFRKSQENRDRKRESTMSTDSAMGFLRASASKDSKTAKPISDENSKSPDDELNGELIGKLQTLSDSLSNWIAEQNEMEDVPVQKEIQDIANFISNLTKGKESNPNGIIDGLT